MHFADVYLFKNKSDTTPVKWKEIEVYFKHHALNHSTSPFEVEISLDEELQGLLALKGERLRLQTVGVDDDEIPNGYICYDLLNWSFSGKRLIVDNPVENVHRHIIPFT